METDMKKFMMEKGITRTFLRLIFDVTRVIYAVGHLEFCIRKWYQTAHFIPNGDAKLVVRRPAKVFLFSMCSLKFHVGNGNGRQYKQTVSLSEFRKRLYRHLGATACNLTSLDLLDRLSIGARYEYDYRLTHDCA